MPADASSTAPPGDRARRVLAVDGGQSATRLRHSSGGRDVVVPGVSRLEGDTVEAVADAIGIGWRQGGFAPVDRAVLGLTTAPSGEGEAGRLCALVAATTGAPEVWLADDSVTAHAGALSMGWGVSVVAGTGVACLAMPRTGEPRILGGHGYLLGDEGGGFWIGRRALAVVARAAEGRGRDGDPAALARAAEQRFGSIDGLAARLFGLERPVDAIARFAVDVLASADAGDPLARAIVRDAAGELVALAEAAVRGIGDAAEPVPLALGGRLLEEPTALRRAVDEALAAVRLPIAPRSADGSALDGAMRLARGDDPGRYRDLVVRWRGEAARAPARPVVPSAGRRYLAVARGLVGRLGADGWDAIEAGADLVVSAVERGGAIHAFGSGHSHVLAEELYHRAGGLVGVRPILVDELMLHVDPARSTALERTRGVAASILADHPVDAGDVVIVASNSGGNAVAVELAQAARAAGASVIAVTSLAHATSEAARRSDLPRLHEVADVVVDNGGVPGDAAVTIEGFARRVGPTSTVVGAAIVDAIVAEAVERLVARGRAPDVYLSGNVAGGDAANEPFDAGGGSGAGG